MAHYVLWIDSDNAHIFTLKDSGVEKTNLKREEINHHTTNKKDHHGDPSVEHFYKHVAERVADANELLILGPGLAKNHFKTHLETHAAGLAKKIVGLEDTDHPTDNQILALARKFFKTYNLFNNPVQET
jgi:stalled ribosome rescue protein Dom34